MKIVCLDLEGVLVPEIWQAVADKTGIAELRRTTRDEPDYDKLMHFRLDLLKKHHLKFSDIEQVIATMNPMDGAIAFLDGLRQSYQVIILSDTFAEFAKPLMQKLGLPTLFCHHLIINNNVITGYRLRMKDQKKAAVAALQGLNFRVVASGDSYNDCSMLQQADAGFFFHAPDSIRQQFPQFAATDDYAALRQMMDAAFERF